MQTPAERGLRWLTVAPAIWFAHFVLTYASVAIWCAKVAGRAGSLGAVRWLIVGYTLVALAGVIGTGIWGYRRHGHGMATVPHDFDTREDRQRFIGFAVLLLCGLSAVGIVYVALPAAFIGSCR